MDLEEGIRRKFQAPGSRFDERTRRLWAAAEAEEIGRGGPAIVARATGMSLQTIAAGRKELAGESDAGAGDGLQRVRKPGGGRKKATDLDPTLKADLERLVEPVTRGDPESPLRWTCKSLRRLAAELNDQGHKTSHRMVGELLQEAGYSLQANSKTLEGGDHPDRNAQFGHVAGRVQRQMTAGNPVISVETKKKEPVGNFKSPGRERRPKGTPEKVRV